MKLQQILIITIQQQNKYCYCFCGKAMISTVVPTKSDSDVIFCVQLVSKT